MYELLKKQVTKEIEKQTKETKECFTKEGYDFTLKRYLTGLRIKQLANGEITREQAIEIATKKLIKEDAKRLANKLKHIDEVAQAQDIETITISVEWSRNKTWGFNPHASVWACDFTQGTASGCGYDKESSAIAEAFNKNNAILKILYNIKEKALQENENITNRDACGYGAGYGALPYYEGGVGTNCFVWILKGYGFKCEEAHGKHFDSYSFRKA